MLLWTTAIRSCHRREQMSTKLVHTWITILWQWSIYYILIDPENSHLVFPLLLRIYHSSQLFAYLIINNFTHSENVCLITYLWFCVSMYTYSFCGILRLDCFENKIYNPIHILFLTIDKHDTNIYHLFLLHVYKT